MNSLPNADLNLGRNQLQWSLIDSQLIAVIQVLAQLHPSLDRLVNATVYEYSRRVYSSSTSLIGLD